jgi:hypothetical protein
LMLARPDFGGPLGSLAEVRPDVAAEWHPTRNGHLTPESVSAGSNRHVWWRCSQNPAHVWCARVLSRGRDNAGCPYCARKRTSPELSLKGLRPLLAMEWHPSLNDGLRPNDVRVSSPAVVWWRCSRERRHEWRAAVNRRAYRDAGCPRCASLAVRHPEVAAAWHPTKNGRLTPMDVSPGSNRVVWWRCPAGGHAFRSAVYNRVRARRCPRCGVEVR